MRGIEPPYSAWEADVLPLNYIRVEPQASASVAGGPSGRPGYGAGRDPVGPHACARRSRPGASSSSRSTRRYDPAVVDRRARRRAVPGVPQPHGRGHRRQAGPHRPHRAGRDPRRRRVHAPPRRVRARLDAGARRRARRPRGPHRGQELARAAGVADPLHGRVHRRRVRRAHHAGAGQRRQPADHDLPGHEDRPDQLHGDDHAGRASRTARVRPGPSTRASGGRRRAGTSRTSADASAVGGRRPGTAVDRCRACAVSRPTDPGGRGGAGAGVRATSTPTARRSAPTTSPAARRW